MHLPEIAQKASGSGQPGVQPPLHLPPRGGSALARLMRREDRQRSGPLVAAGEKTIPSSQEATMRPLLRFALAAAMVPLLGCADRQPTTPPPPQDVAGFWTGTIQQGLQATRGTGIGVGGGETGSLEEVEMALVEDLTGQITGIGALLPRQTGPLAGRTTGTPAAAAMAFQVQGANSFPTVVLSLRSGGPQLQTDLVYFRGEFTGVDRISARLIGGGFSNERVELRRTTRPPATTR
jgi:hypothetical protein